MSRVGLGFTVIVTAASARFAITKRMLDMFRRPGDPDEHHGLYAIPAAALIGGCLAGQLAGAAARGWRGVAPCLATAREGCGPSERLLGAGARGARWSRCSICCSSWSTGC